VTALLQSGMLPPAENQGRATENGGTVARPRWQEGRVFKRGKRKQVWVGRFREDAIGADGRRVRWHRSVVLGPVGRMGYREARRRLSECLAAINQGRHKPEVRIPFSRFVVERWEPAILPTLRYSTARNYRHVVRRHLLPALGETVLGEIGAAEVQMLLAEKSKRLAPWTVHQIRAVLSKIFSVAQSWGYVHGNPAEKVQTPELVGRREHFALTPEQVLALLVELAEPYRAAVLLAVLSGLRRGEIFGLRWKHVDSSEGSVTVAECSYEGRTSAPKTRASRRKVFVGGAVIEALARIRPEPFDGEALVFSTERGTAFHPRNVDRRVLAPAAERAGIPHVSWHDFRRTYATWANASGESIKALQAQLGHTDSRLTLGVYTQPMPEAQRQIAAKVERVLCPIVPKFEGGQSGSKELPN
jgi:integrase